MSDDRSLAPSDAAKPCRNLIDCRPVDQERRCVNPLGGDAERGFSFEGSVFPIGKEEKKDKYKCVFFF